MKLVRITLACLVMSLPLVLLAQSATVAHKKSNSSTPKNLHSTSMLITAAYQEKLIQLLHESFPESKDVPSDEMNRVLHRVLQKGVGYGLDNQADLASYVITAYVLGENFDEEVPEAAQVLRNRGYNSHQKAAILENFVQQTLQALEQDEELAGKVGAQQAANRSQAQATGETSMSDYLTMETDSKAYRQLADWAVEKLRKGDVDAVIQQFSPNFIDYLGLQQVQSVFKKEMVPFFAGSTGLENSTTVTKTHDSFGSSGFAFYMSLNTGGQVKPFVMYLVKENDRIVLANLVLNKTYADLH
jgi:hypothetical protein